MSAVTNEARPATPMPTTLKREPCFSNPGAAFFAALRAEDEIKPRVGHPKIMGVSVFQITPEKAAQMLKKTETGNG